MSSAQVLPVLSIIIPTVGRAQILDRTLEAVFAAIGNRHVEIIVVDDSKNGIAKQRKYPVHYVKSGGIGAAGARNTGWTCARSELLLFLDDDILIEERHLTRTLELHQQPAAVAYNFFWVYPSDLMERLPKSKFGRYILKHKLYSNEHRLDFDPSRAGAFVEEKGLTSQYFSIEKKWMEAVGGYDPIPYAGVEDLMLYKKLAAQGVTVQLSLKDVVYQNESNRLTIEALENRYRTGAFTRKLAAARGHAELGMRFSHLQRVFGALHLVFRPLAMAINLLMPFGIAYEKALHIRLSIASYRGYCGKMEYSAGDTELTKKAPQPDN